MITVYWPMDLLMAHFVLLFMYGCMISSKRAGVEVWIQIHLPYIYSISYLLLFRWVFQNSFDFWFLFHAKCTKWWIDNSVNEILKWESIFRNEKCLRTTALEIKIKFKAAIFLKKSWHPFRPFLFVSGLFYLILAVSFSLFLWFYILL